MTKASLLELLKKLRLLGVEAGEELSEAEEIDTEAWREKVATKGVADMPAETTVDLAPLTELVKGLSDSVAALTELVKAQPATIEALGNALTAQSEKLEAMQAELTGMQADMKATVEKAAQAIETADAVTSELKKSAATNGKPLTPAMAQQVADSNAAAGGVAAAPQKRFKMAAQLAGN